MNPEIQATRTPYTKTYINGPSATLRTPPPVTPPTTPLGHPPPAILPTPTPGPPPSPPRATTPPSTGRPTTLSKLITRK